MERHKGAGEDSGLVLGDDLSDLSRFFSIDENGCWLSPTKGRIRGRASGDTRPVADLPKFKPRRWVWLVANGLASDPDSARTIQLLRTCPTKRCCNPAHVEPSGQNHKGDVTDSVHIAAPSEPVVTDDLFELASRCDMVSGCWYFPAGSRARCRASGDPKAAAELPVLALHRWTWAVAHGYASDPGPNIHVRRRCKSKRCCNPDHLYATTTDGVELTDAEAARLIGTEIASQNEWTETPPKLPYVDRRPHTWIDAFPWLRGAAESDSQFWWESPIDEKGTARRQQRIGMISDLAIERLTRWTVGQIFPGLPPDLSLDELDIPVRALNALKRGKFRYASDLIPVTLDDILDWQNVGVGTVDALLRALADESTSIETPTVSVGRGPESHAQSSHNEEANAWLTSVKDRLSHIANWYAIIGLPDHSLLNSQASLGTPRSVVEAQRQLHSLTADSVLGESAHELDVARLFDKALTQFDFRTVEILRDRLFADDPATLDELGRQHNITRERVRQIEGKARGQLLSFISEDGPLASIAEAVRTIIGTIRPLDDLLDVIPALGREVKSVAQPAWRVLDRLDDAYEIEDGWCVVPTMTAAQTMTSTQLQERADRYGVVRLEDFDLIGSNDTNRQNELATSWLRFCGFVVENGFVITRTQSAGDYAAAILSLAATPLSAKEIVGKFVFERSLGSVRNAMAADERFERVDRDRWALKEWGMEAYSGIRSLIREQIARGGGRVKLDDVIEYITGRYSVSASSVISYASAPPFHLRDGIVTLAGTDRESRKTPERTRRLYRVHDAWIYRIRVTKDHLRGSGSVAPVALANILGIGYGDTRQLRSRLGPQTVSWTGTQPSIGTIRRFLLDADIAADTEAFLILADDGAFDFRPARPLTGNPLLDALTLIGAPVTDDRQEARSLLADAIGLDKSTPVTSVIGAYRDRGDADIADLLISVRDYLETGDAAPQPVSQTDVEEILDLL